VTDPYRLLAERSDDVSAFVPSQAQLDFYFDGFAELFSRACSADPRGLSFGQSMDAIVLALAFARRSAAIGRFPSRSDHIRGVIDRVLEQWPRFTGKDGTEIVLLADARGYLRQLARVLAGPLPDSNK